MAVPISGAISLAKIRNEFEQNDYDHSLYGYTTGPTSLGDMWDGTYGAINTNSTDPGGTTFTSKAAAPDKISELMGYNHDAAPAFSWGTPGSITSNAGSIYNQTSSDDEGGGDVRLRSFVKLSHPSSGTINFQFETRRVGDIGGNTVTSTNTASLTYTGTLTSLEARIVFTSVDFRRIGGGSSPSYTSDAARGEQHEIYSGSSHMTNTGGTEAAINLPTTGQAEDTNNNITRSYRTMSTSASSSIGLMVEAEAGGGTFDYSTAEIQGDSSSETIKIELRANGSSTVTLYERVGPFRMLADSFVDATT